MPPVPDVQQPPVEHVEHCAPPCPHDEPDIDPNASHVPLVPPLQHPSGHVLASHEHVPLVVSQRPLPHTAQVAPPVPHSDELCDAKATHVDPLQQPPGHELASHTHAPLLVLHACPDPQEAHAAPPCPHSENPSDA